MKLLFILPGLALGACCGCMLLSEWIRVVVLQRHESVFLFHLPWANTGIGWYPRTVAGYAWMSLANAVLLLALSTLLMLSWTLQVAPGHERSAWLLPIIYVFLAVWFVVRPGLS